MKWKLAFLLVRTESKFAKIEPSLTKPVASNSEKLVTFTSPGIPQRPQTSRMPERAQIHRRKKLYYMTKVKRLQQNTNTKYSSQNSCPKIGLQQHSRSNSERATLFKNERDEGAGPGRVESSARVGGER
jgi:hypothetical protein